METERSNSNMQAAAPEESATGRDQQLQRDEGLAGDEAASSHVTEDLPDMLGDHSTSSGVPAEAGLGQKEGHAAERGSSGARRDDSSRSKTEYLAQLRRGEQLHEAEIYEELLQRVQQRKATQPPPLVVQLPVSRSRPAVVASAGSLSAGQGEQDVKKEEEVDFSVTAATASAMAAANGSPTAGLKREVIYERIGKQKKTDEDTTSKELDEKDALNVAGRTRVEIACFKNDPEWVFQQFSGKRIDADVRFDDSLERLSAVKRTGSLLTQHRKPGGLHFSRETPRHRYIRLLREVPEAIADAKEFCRQMALLAELHRREEAQVGESDVSYATRLNVTLDKTRRELAEHVKRHFAAAAFPLDKFMGDSGFAVSESGIAEEEILNPLYCPHDGVPLQTLAAVARSVLYSGNAAQRGGRRRLAALDRRRGGPGFLDAAAGARPSTRRVGVLGDSADGNTTHVGVDTQTSQKAAGAESAEGDLAAAPDAEVAAAIAARIPGAPASARADEERRRVPRRDVGSRQMPGAVTVAPTGLPSGFAGGTSTRNVEVSMRIQNQARNVEAAATELALRTRAVQERLDALCRVVWGEEKPATGDATAAHKIAKQTDNNSLGTASAHADGASPADGPATGTAANSGAADAIVTEAEVAHRGSAEPPASSTEEAATETPHSDSEAVGNVVEVSFFDQDLTTQLQQLHALAGGGISDDKLDGVEARLRLLKRQLEEQHDSFQQRNQERARHRQRQHQRETADEEREALLDEWLPEKLVQKMHEALAPFLLSLHASEKVDSIQKKLGDVFASHTQIVQLLLRLHRCEKQHKVVQASISASLELLKTLSTANSGKKQGDGIGRTMNSTKDMELRAEEVEVRTVRVEASL